MWRRRFSLSVNSSTIAQASLRVFPSTGIDILRVEVRAGRTGILNITRGCRAFPQAAEFPRRGNAWRGASALAKIGLMQPPYAQVAPAIGLDAATLVRWYRTIFAARRVDDREIQLKRQNKIFFQISGAGHEAVLVAAGQLLKPGYDWFYLYYRDRALCLALGLSVEAQLLQAVGAADDPQSGGRQRPSHWGSRELNIVSTSSPTGTQFLNAVGCAEARTRKERIPELANDPDVRDDDIVLVTSGDGTTSEGEFWESLNTACNLALPVLYLIEDNKYAISVPVEVQTAGGSISRLVRSFPGLYVTECDGCDPLDSYRAFEGAVAHVRGRDR